MDISERLNRQESEDIIVIEKLLASECGRLVSLMITNLLNMELSHSRSDDASADRKLGRLEAYRNILDDIQAFHDRATELQQPKVPETTESFEAEEQVVAPLRGGEI